MSGWFAIVDGAADPRLYPVVTQSSKHVCLYEDDYSEETRAALPYLVELIDGEQLPDLWRKHEPGRYWGIVCQSSLDLPALRRHLRKFTTARLPLGDVVLFRFWDPRVFVTFVEEGSEDEVAPFFEKIAAVIADLGAEGRRRYSWDGALQSSFAQPRASTPAPQPQA
ncbi:DUF4123 domain-containing protein [Erythrobacter sp. JK5]|uniref:DUF4123 domain-containing protein n=1 Tax=Erythrobacter sp. JK5 TaxID=2829500 RepID=UPI001BAB6976|nr:DUF4123 domain-containing protein [Erythrobacter sp. JK5]QUL36788.1 DUF4123 domain-containing protein [Erythrobacter sp. JK5]